MSARPNVIPLHRGGGLLKRRMRARALLDDGSSVEHVGTWLCTMDAILDMDSRIPAGRRALRIDSKVLSIATPGEHADTWADTVAPDQADEASEALASRPSPFDTAITGHDDTAFAPRFVEAALHAEAARMLACDREQLMAARRAGFEPGEAARFLGLTTFRPRAASDQQAVAELLAVQQRQRNARAEELLMAHDPLAHIPGPARARPIVPQALRDIDYAQHTRATPTPRVPSMLDDIRADWKHTSTRARAAFAVCFVAALFSGLWWAGVL